MTIMYVPPLAQPSFFVTLAVTDAAIVTFRIVLELLLAIAKATDCNMRSR